jgi:hypothetical protein
MSVAHTLSVTYPRYGNNGSSLQDSERGTDDKDEKVQALIKDNFYFKQVSSTMMQGASMHTATRCGQRLSFALVIGM